MALADSYYFLELEPKVEGEAQTEGFEKMIHVTGFSTGLSLPVHWDTSNGDRTTGMPEVHGFTLSKRKDKASPDLKAALWQAKCYSKATIHLVRQDSKLQKNLEYMKFELDKVYITSIQGEDFETMSLSFNKMKWVYVPQQKGMGAAGNVPFTYDLEKNKAE